MAFASPTRHCNAPNPVIPGERPEMTALSKFT